MSDQILELAEKSASTDLAFLLKAKEEAKKRMKDNPGPENIRAFNAARGAVENEVSRIGSSAPGRVFKSQTDAVGFLTNYGFKTSTSSFNRDVKKGLLARNAEGHFEERVLLAYAGVHLEPTGHLGDKAQGKAAVERLSADAELKTIQAKRQQLKLEKEQGLVMFKSQHERDLGARARFFKAEVRNFIRLHGPGIIHLVGGDETRLPQLVDFWEGSTAGWMNTWAQERQFVVELDDENENDEEESEA